MGIFDSFADAVTSFVSSITGGSSGNSNSSTTTPATTGGNARSNNAVNSKYTTETPVHSSAKEYTNPADTVPKTTAPATETKPENKVYDAGSQHAAQSYAVETGFQKNIEAATQIMENTANENSVIPFVDTAISWRNEQYDKAAEYIESGNIAGGAAAIIPPFLADVVLPLDALNVTNKLGALVAGTSETANLSEYELQVGGIDAVISAIPIIGPAQRLIKTASKAFATSGAKTAETATSKALKEIAEETGESAISKTVKEGAEETAEYAVKSTGAYKVARTVDNVAVPLMGTAATFAISETTANETPEETPEETTTPSPFDFSEVPETDIWNSGNFWEGGTADAGETSWINYGTDEEAGTTSAGIDTEIDRIIKDYTAPALIALAALAALAVMNYALSKGGKPNGQK